MVHSLRMRLTEPELQRLAPALAAVLPVAAIASALAVASALALAALAVAAATVETD